MGRTRRRRTTRRLVIAVALIALLLGGLTRFAQRPYPVFWFAGPDDLDYCINWSNNTGSRLDSGPYPLQIVRTRWVIGARWPDGSWGIYLRPIDARAEGGWAGLGHLESRQDR